MAELKMDSFDESTLQEVLKPGTDLRKYSRQVEKELRDIEDKSIKDYIKESENIASLHNQICSCDGILERMEEMLLTFQNDLGSISNEIVTLQKKSVQMSQQLSNRQAVRAPLSQFIDDISVSEDLINAILDAPVTDNDFATQLENLNHKINFVKEQSYQDVKCIQDVDVVLDNLRIKAVTKIRAFLLEQVSKFKKPLTNYQIPQNILLKHKFQFEFLLGHKRSIAVEVSDEYNDTLKKVYLSYFKAYESRLMKLQYEEAASKDDLMGIEDTASRGGIFHKAVLKNKATVFTIGNRGEVLTSQLDAPIIVPHTAQKNKFPYEALFRSVQYALLDNACREYLFLCEFFILQPPQSLQVFNRIWDKTLVYLLERIENHIDTTFDSISLFLCAHIVLRYRMLCHKRAVPALDVYWDTLQQLIWKRFEIVMGMNIKSVRDCDAGKMGTEKGPHYVTRRYAELSAAMVGLSESFPSDQVTGLLAQLQEEVELLLLKMAAAFPQRKEQLIFLINNYDMILSVLMERTRENSKEADSFREQLNQKSKEYVEEILSPRFGGLMMFVREGEALLDKGQQDELRQLDKKAQQLVEIFSNSWKKSLEDLNSEILRSFSSLVTGGTILQMALTTLVQYYQRFHTLLSPATRGQLTRHSPEVKSLNDNCGRFKVSLNTSMFILCYIFCFLYVSVKAYLPVYIVHGVLSANFSMSPLSKRIKEMHPNTTIYISNMYDGWASLEPMWRQVQKFGEEFRNISERHPEGFHLIGYSQGGLISRALLETHPKHNVKNFVSLSSPQAGQYGTKFLHIFFPDLALETAYKVFYTLGGQLISVGNYWNDPHHQGLFYQYSAFLPLLNNEISTKLNATYKVGLTRLNRLILIGGPDDGVITPWQSSLFGFYDENEMIVEMRDRDVYLNGYLGLKELDERGKVNIYEIEGVEHHAWRKNFSVVDNYILPFLD